MFNSLKRMLKTDSNIDSKKTKKSYDYICDKDKDLTCPKCNSNNKAYILYGMPIFNDDLNDALERKNVVLGGCCIHLIENDEGILLNPAKYKCNDCGEEFHFEEYKSPKNIKTTDY